METGKTQNLRLHELSIADSDTVFILNDADDDKPNAFGYGNNVKASYDNSQAFGDNTNTCADNQMVIGSFNDKADSVGKLFIVGNGTDESNRNNAFTVSYNGDVCAQGEVKATSNIETDANIVAKQKIITPLLQSSNSNYDTLHILKKDKNGQLFNDPILCQSDLTITSTPLISLGKQKGVLKLNISNLPAKQQEYEIRLVVRSHYRGSTLGEWREISAKNNYGYASLIGTNVLRTNPNLTFPDAPEWMPNKGQLRHSWEFTSQENDTAFLQEINAKTWLLDLCKPLAVGNTYKTKGIQNIENNINLTFESKDAPAIAGLIGLSLTSGYRGLQFKFRLYQKNGAMIAETNEYVSISGGQGKDIKNIAGTQLPSSAYVLLGTSKNTLAIENLYMTIE